ncbi:MAG: hypothetical protein LKM38_29050 [Pseudomonas veronii]|jgi:hypothetical protein|nr:hypothetical protein [Pseudomonas veronii]
MARLRAITAPMPPPMTMPPSDQAEGPAGGVRRRPQRRQRGADRDGHADHAEEIALADVVGLDSPRSARMNSTPGDQIKKLRR